MDNTGLIYVTFDFQTDTPQGKDPDALSPTLRRYHRLLWSKPLPSGVMFELVDTTPGIYLHHHSQLGEFWLASDAVIPTFRKEAHLSQVLAQIPEELDTFRNIGSTIGGMMLFPSNRVGRHMTINSARGFHPRIKDRFDLTVECIRRFYLNEDSPLTDTLARYADYFRLFADFRGYMEFFLLQDLVTADYSAVRFFSPFQGFTSSPVPDGLAAYLDYRALAVGFIEARNERIKAWWSDYRLIGTRLQPTAAGEIRSRRG